MEPLGRSLLVIGVLAALAASPGPRLSVSVSPKPAGLEAGGVWQPTIRIRRAGRPLTGARPVLVVAKRGSRRAYRARAAGRGVYRARVLFASAGRWTYSVRVGERTIRLGSVSVRAAAVRLVAAGDVVIDNDGSLVVADILGNQVVRLTGARLTRLARLTFPVEVALDPRGGIAVVTEERRVQHISAAGVRTIAGSATPGFSGDGGPATAAQLDQPTSIAFDSAGNLFITELGGRIRRVDRASGTITTFAGIGGQGFGGDGGPAVRAQLDRPHGLAVAGDGTVYFGDTFNNRVRRVAPDGTISTVASGLSTPNDVTLAADGTLYATDYGANRILRITGSGPATVAAADGPNSVAVGGDGAVYATERTHPWVLRIDSNGTTRLPRTKD